MKIRLISPFFGKRWLVDWRGLLPYWQRSWQYNSVAKVVMQPSYDPFWFKRCGDEFKFIPGHIWFDGEAIFFTNGTHRTRVLALGTSPIIPITAHAGTYKHKALKQYFIRRIEPGEIVTIPDFPVKEPDEIKAAM